ncbi:DUF1573 domain-containing protein [Planctomicrobium sp. SH661]|uniref:DUF1573 domain-containing protein n=1 Tax=Planctomicrobium sp. SH661 TaxID=3448124 RepID=UPI003F5B9FA6
MRSQACKLGAMALAFCLSASAAHAQQTGENWATKMFSELKHDFGTVARGADTRAILIVENIYEEDVTIDNVGTTCGCTAAKPNKNLLKTGEKAEIEIKMNTVKFMRRKDSNVDVTLTFRGPQGASTKTVRVPITAYIRSDVVVSPEPGNANFGTVEFGQGAERKLEIAYAGRDDWAINEVRVPDERIQASVREVFRAPGQVRYELTVNLKDNAPMGAIQDQIRLITNDVNSPEVPVMVLGNVEPDIVFAPSGVFPLGNLKPGEVKEFRVVLRGKRPFAIQHIQCDAADCFEVQQPGAELKTVHIVPFKMTAPDKPGPFSENFTFTISGRAEPLTCKAEGQIGSGT